MYKFTFKNGDELELKGFKHAEFASQETHCFEASVYFKGKKIGVVSNEGHGGCDDFSPCGNLEDGSYHKNNEIFKDACWHMKDEGVWVSEWDGSENPLTIDVWCCDQVNKFLSHRDFKKYMKSKVVFIDPTSDKPNAVRYFSFKGVRKITQQHIDHIVAKYKDYKILNVLPEAEAWKLWQAGA